MLIISRYTCATTAQQSYLIHTFKSDKLIDVSPVIVGAKAFEYATKMLLSRHKTTAFVDVKYVRDLKLKLDNKGN